MTAKLGLVDPSSYSNADNIAITHISLHLDVDFSTRVLKGRAELLCLRKALHTTILILDSKDLLIHKVNTDAGDILNYTLSQSFKTFGFALSVDIPDGPQNSSLKIIIEYETSPSASGLLWLTPQQTLGKKQPYMFSQFQAIHARSVYPCQDTPSVKFTYTSAISAPEELNVLMSALNVGEPKSIAGCRKLSMFRQPLPIPSYLVAFAVGRIEGRRISDMTTIWAEPEALEAAVYEFAETDVMMEAAVDLCGPYEWGVYDLLVMPPSFIFGGMENPCITFVTPTDLAGDRSHVEVIAHEVSHSWSGNLVTNKTYEHFWLNEGWTMFLQQKIQEKLHGTAVRHFHALQGLEILKETVEKTLGIDSEFTKLVPNLTDTDPDDAYSFVPYEKGHTFLFYLEQLMGGAESFNPFIKAYFANFRKASITTDDFKQFFLNYFKDRKELKQIDWEGWLYSKGMPVVIPHYDSSLTEACDELVQKWRKWPEDRSAADIMGLTSQQIPLFLCKLLEGGALPLETVRRMEKLYSLEESRNWEIRFRWLRIGLKAHDLEFLPKALEFVNSQGRLKFVRPIYRDLYDWEDVRQQSIDNYHKNKHGMMVALAVQLLKDLHLTPED